MHLDGKWLLSHEQHPGNSLAVFSASRALRGSFSLAHSSQTGVPHERLPENAYVTIMNTAMTSPAKSQSTGAVFSSPFDIAKQLSHTWQMDSPLSPSVCSKEAVSHSDIGPSDEDLLMSVAHNVGPRDPPPTPPTTPTVQEAEASPTSETSSCRLDALSRAGRTLDSRDPTACSTTACAQTQGLQPL